ncbi:MAG TPA: methylenetetrahydrofolate reductase [bacterium]|nr:methylenetetrahydrofolate reductase [bacterium]
MGLRQALESGQFVITTEVGPPHGVDTTAFMKHALALKGKVDAINVTENQRAMAHLGSLACCKLLVDNGIDAVMHLNCRDANRLGLQAHVMAAYALGIRNVLVIGGDKAASGNQPDTKEVYDLNPGEALAMCQMLRDGTDMAGEPLDGACTELMIGAAANLTAPDPDLEYAKTESKVQGGATFFQTQGIYDIPRTREFVERIRPLGVPVLAGIIPMRNEKMAEMLKFKVPGMWIPDDVYERHIKSDDMFETAVQFSAEIIAGLRGIVDGVHIMTIGSRKMTEALIERVYAMGLR